VAFNADDPISYLNQLSIHKDFCVAEIPLKPARVMMT
jgi:hypothetical protein